MPIEKVSVSNFKGISESADFEIKPVTLFIGPNSSGKSSSLHALAAMAQTVKLAGSKLPIVLDDEFAQVHLGRFIEVIHSKSYSDSIDIGITFPVSRGYSFSKRTIFKKGDAVTASFSFRSTKRTQDIYIDRADFSTPSMSLSYRKSKGDEYTVRVGGKIMPLTARHTGGMAFSVVPNGATVTSSDDLLVTLMASQVLGELVSEELRKVLYLGPFRQSPLRRYPTRGSAPVEVGPQGESAVTLLANEYVQRKTRNHNKQIGSWMTTLGLAKSVDVSRVGGSDLFDVSLTLSDDAKFAVADLGYGISQVLPVLAQCSFAPRGATLLFEQPELHLHPGAAKGLGSVFVDVAKKNDLRIIAETHSRELFCQVLDEVREKRIDLSDVVAYKVTRKNGCSHFSKIEIVEDDGSIEVLSPWDNEIMRR